MGKPSCIDFARSAYPWRIDVDYRAHPELYRVGRGEQGVLICEPYKGELVPLWRFKTPPIATESSRAIYEKFLQMGFTPARRSADYKGGRKFDSADKHLPKKGTGDSEKAESARIFYEAWQRAETRPAYARKKAGWTERYG